jgi:hypothetical protein
MKNNKTRNAKKKNIVKRNHRARKTQHGGNYNYDIDISTNSEFIFITTKTTPKLIYKIDLPYKTFSKYVFESGGYPLNQRRDPVLFRILSKEKRINPVIDNLLASHGITNVLYHLTETQFPQSLRSRPLTPKTRKLKPLTLFNPEIYPIQEDIEEDIRESPDELPIVVNKVSPVISPVISPVTIPRVLTRSSAKTFKNSKAFSQLKQAVKFSDNMKGSPYLSNIKGRK